MHQADKLPIETFYHQQIILRYRLDRVASAYIPLAFSVNVVSISIRTSGLHRHLCNFLFV